VDVGGTGVNVAVGGTGEDVLVGGMIVAVDGTGVGVLLGWMVAVLHPTNKNTTIIIARSCHSVFLRFILFLTLIGYIVDNP